LGYYLSLTGLGKEEMLKLPAKAGGFNPPKKRQKNHHRMIKFIFSKIKSRS
jgi:hypothetical protein